MYIKAVNLCEYGINETRIFSHREENRIEDIVKQSENIICEAYDRKEIEIKGATICSSMKANKLLVRGFLVVEGDLEVDEIVIQGILFCKGVVLCKLFIIQGIVQLNENCLVSDEIKIQGKVTAKKDLKVELLRLFGSCDIHKLEAKSIEIHNSNNSNQNGFVCCYDMVTNDET